MWLTMNIGGLTYLLRANWQMHSDAIIFPDSSLLLSHSSLPQCSYVHSNSNRKFDLLWTDARSIQDNHQLTLDLKTLLCISLKRRARLSIRDTNRSTVENTTNVFVWTGEHPILWTLLFHIRLTVAAFFQCPNCTYTGHWSWQHNHTNSRVPNAITIRWQANSEIAEPEPPTLRANTNSIQFMLSTFFFLESNVCVFIWYVYCTYFISCPKTHFYLTIYLSIFYSFVQLLIEPYPMNHSHLAQCVYGNQS